MQHPPTVRLNVRGRVHEFVAESVSIGRGADNDLALDNIYLSKRHGELVWQGGGVVYRDCGSTHGSYAGDGSRLVADLPIGEAPVRFYLGRPDVGELVEATAIAPRPAPPIPPPPPPPPPEQTPPPQLHDRGGGAETVVIDQRIRVQLEGFTREFFPPGPIDIGRDEGNNLITTNPTVGRRHVSLQFDGRDWNLVDLDSRYGTWVDGERVKTRTLRGSTLAVLGDPQAGERLVLVAHGSPADERATHRARWWRKNRVLVGVGALAVVALAAALLVVFNRDSGSGDPFASRSLRDRLVRATPHISGTDGTRTWKGSGTIIDAKLGLILTNAHVAMPQADGRAAANGIPSARELGNPKRLSVDIAPGLGQPAEPAFFAEVVAVDGYLDLAVLKITTTADGAAVSSDDLARLAEVRLGDSPTADVGDPILVVGYPGVAESEAASLTTGVLTSPVESKRIGNPRAFLNVDAAINQGNSGGLAADRKGTIVGVPTLVSIRGINRIARIRSIELALPLVEAARQGDDYVSPYIQPLGGSEKITRVEMTALGKQGFEPTCSGGAAPTSVGSAVSVAVTYSGFTAADHQDFLVELRSGSKVLAASVSDDAWPLAIKSSGCFTATLGLESPLPAGSYTIDVFAGPSLVALKSSATLTLTVR